MNKKSLLSLCLFGASAVLSFTAMHIMEFVTTNKWVGVSVALSLFVVMFIMLFAVISKAPEKYEKPAQFAALAVNAIADGMAISSLFTHMGRFPAIWQSAIAVVVLIGLFALYLPLTRIPFVRNHYIISMLIYALAIIGAGIACCVAATPAVVRICILAMLYMIIFIAFFITLADRARNAKEHIEKIAYFSFAGIIVAIIVLIIISDGDADLPIDGFGGDIGAAGATKKRNPYDFSPYDYAAFGAIANANMQNAQYAEPTEDIPPQPPLKPLF